MRRKIPFESKVEFLQKHKDLVDSNSWDKLVELARQELDYSPKTIRIDIEGGLTRALEKIRKSV